MHLGIGVALIVDLADVDVGNGLTWVHGTLLFLFFSTQSVGILRDSRLARQGKTQSFRLALDDH
ncbi:hypothetical protein PproGo58_32560 [Pseudomonas protegens]|nr:hypothetical protein PproGo58_32560 [Pseudomonas protegens]